MDKFKLSRRQLVQNLSALSAGALLGTHLTSNAAGVPGFGPGVVPMPKGGFLSSAPIHLTDYDLYYLWEGLGVTASGGGGGFEVAGALVAAIQAEIPIDKWILYPVSGALDSDMAVMVGGIGAPSAVNPTSITQFGTFGDFAIRTFSREKGVTINSILPVEAGPVNALLAMYLGWKFGYKVFDCDGAGRAVPSLTNLTYAYNGTPIAPLYLAGKVNGVLAAAEVTPAPTSAAGAEAAIRTHLGKYGEAAALVCWLQSGAELKQSTYLLAGSMSAAISLGSLLFPTQWAHDPLVNVLNQFAVRVDSGILTNVQVGTQPGYDDGMLYIQTNTEQLGVHYLNENLMFGKFNGNVFTPIATAPMIMATFVAIYGDDCFMPVNNGDNLQNYIGCKIVFALVKSSCVLYSTGAPGAPSLQKSFKDVLAAAPFNYSGPLLPAPFQCF